MSGRNTGPDLIPSLKNSTVFLPSLRQVISVFGPVSVMVHNLQSVVLIVLDQNDHKGVRSILVPSIGNRNINSEPLPSSLSTQMLPPYR